MTFESIRRQGNERKNSILSILTMLIKKLSNSTTIELRRAADQNHWASNRVSSSFSTSFFVVPFEIVHSYEFRSAMCIPRKKRGERRERKSEREREKKKKKDVSQTQIENCAIFSNFFLLEGGLRSFLLSPNFSRRLVHSYSFFRQSC